MKLVIITGLSGSGKSIALTTLEDLGYYCIDNLPLFLLPALTESLVVRQDSRFELTAVGIDARNQASDLSGLNLLLDSLREHGIQYDIIYLDAQDETLIKRYSETRRRHPLSDKDHPLAEAIKLERKILDPFASATDLHIDTTHTNLHQLREMIRQRVGTRPDSQISLLVESFGFKHGVPRDTDFVFDVRCLPNPHWQPELRPLTGRDPAVAGFLENDETVRDLRDDIIGFLERWIPRFQADGRSYLTVAIGCTGGQHRSVYMTERLSSHFREAGLQIQTRHRELA